MKNFKIIIAMSLVLIAVVSCRTNEENYRKAYETAVARENDPLEGTIYERFRKQATTQKIVSGTDTISVISERVAIPAQVETPDSVMHRYNVVVGRFRQLFHAKSMMNRFATGGFPESFIVATPEPLYYTIAYSTDQISDADSVAQLLNSESPVRLSDGLPYILRVPNR